MEFRLNEQYKELRKKYTTFAQEEVKPMAKEIDERELFPEATVEKMGQEGYFGIPFPKEYGGQGLDFLTSSLAIEEISKVCASTGVILSTHIALCAAPIFKFGTEEQKKKYLTPLSQGTHLGAFGLTESYAGTDASSIKTTAKLEGDYYILNGSKLFITNAGYADTYVVMAMTDKSKGTKGITAFIVEKGYEGFSFGAFESKMGIRGVCQKELIFDECRVPKENLLGEEGEGFKIAMWALDGGRIGIASQALGIAQGAYDRAVEYSLERVQFGRSISKFQDVQFKLAEMYTKIDAARLMVYRAARTKDSGEKYTMHAAMAKLYASEIAMEITTKVVQIFGGYGFVRDYDVERMMRDAKITEIYEGTSEVQKMVISGNLLYNEKLKMKDQKNREVRIVDTNSKESAKLILEAVKEHCKNSEDKLLIAGGRGMKSKENFNRLYKLGENLNSEVVGTRGVVNMEWLPREYQVGHTGKKVDPKVYLAFGISGAYQHMIGVDQSYYIIAVNKNKEAPIFEHVDLGIIGDVDEILGILLKMMDTDESCSLFVSRSDIS